MNTYTAARRRWELKQEELHGCKYIDGECVVHGTTGLKTEAPPGSANTVEFPLICNCRSFDRPHTLDAHDVLESPFDWRTPEERQDALRGRLAQRPRGGRVPQGKGKHE
jgi:hypothetical protein